MRIMSKGARQAPVAKRTIDNAGNVNYMFQQNRFCDPQARAGQAIFNNGEGMDYAEGRIRR